MNEPATPEDVPSTPASAIRAILEKDFAALEEAVGQGHASITVKLFNASPVSDRSLVLMAIDKDWLEGLDLLLRSGPPFSNRNLEAWKEQALRQGSAATLDYMLAKFPGSANDDWDQPGYLERALINGMGRPSGYSAPLGVIGVDRALRIHGWDTRGVVPGDFVPGDTSTAGHTLWTAALVRRRWSVAKAVWPQVAGHGNYPLAQPGDVVEEALQVDETVSAGTPALLQLLAADEVLAWPRFGEAMQALRHAVLEEEEGALEVLANWWKSAPTIYDLPLPEAATNAADWRALLTLSPEERQPVWAMWEKVRDGEGVTPLHVLALDGRLADAQALLRVAEVDRPAVFQKWSAPTAEGLTPSQIWEEVGCARWAPSWV